MFIMVANDALLRATSLGTNLGGLETHGPLGTQPCELLSLNVLRSCFANVFPEPLNLRKSIHHAGFFSESRFDALEICDPLKKD